MADFLEYDEKIERLKKLVDQACEKIKRGELTLGEAKTQASLIRLKAEESIPGQMDKFDLIYGSRLKRLIEQFLEKNK